MNSGLRHIDVGPELTRSEWESESTHELVHGSAFPGAPVERQLFYRNDLHEWFIYDGSAWVSLQSPAMSIHDNAFHSPNFEEEGVAAIQIEGHRQMEVHAQLQPPQAHGNAAHTPNMATEADHDAHVANQALGLHGSASLPTAERLVHRDANGRARVAAPAHADDIDTQGARSQAISDHGLTGVHIMPQPPQDHDNTRHSPNMLLAPAGTAEWLNRTYAGWELVTTPTTYDIGAGGDFPTLAAAAASLRGLILTQDITLRWIANATDTAMPTFQGLLSAGGELRLNFAGYTHSINLVSGATACLAFRGPFQARLYGGTLSLAHANRNPPWELMLASSLRLLRFDANLIIDGTGWTGSRLVGMVTSNCYYHQMPAANWHNMSASNAMAISHFSLAGCRDQNPPSYNVLAGSMLLLANGNIVTQAGEFTP